jgi:hypothetical protein
MRQIPIGPPNAPERSLKILRVYPPDPFTRTQNLKSANRRYPVCLELSRVLTQYENAAIAGMARTVRAYGTTLEIKKTTLEKVIRNRTRIIALVQRIEAEGRPRRGTRRRRHAHFGRRRERPNARVARRVKLKRQNATGREAMRQ